MTVKKNPQISISIFDFLYVICFVLLSGFKLWHQDFLKPYFPISPLHDIIAGIKKKKKKSQFCMDRIGSSESSVMRYRNIEKDTKHEREISSSQKSHNLCDMLPFQMTTESAKSSRKVIHSHSLKLEGEKTSRQKVQFRFYSARGPALVLRAPHHSARLTEREVKLCAKGREWILPFWMASSFQRGEHFSDGSKIRRKRHFFKTGERHRANARSAFPTSHIGEENIRRRTSSVTLQRLQVVKFGPQCNYILAILNDSLSWPTGIIQHMYC